MLLNSIGKRGKAFQKLSFIARNASIKAAGPAFGSQHDNSRTFVTAGFSGLALLLSVSVCVAEKESTDIKDPLKDVTQKWPKISREEVQFHNSVDRKMWVSYGKGVYDITHFVNNHPGGKERLYGAAGQDIGDSWNLFANHKNSSLAQKLLQDMKIGELDDSEVITAIEEPYVAEFSNEPIYDVIIVGAGLSGLMCGSELIHRYGVPKDKILVLEAQEYVGGRVKQVNDFIKGTKIEVGAEFLHGNNTELTKFARATNQPLREIYCWAHGDGGPLPEPADKGYGLYYIGSEKEGANKAIGAAGDLSNLPYSVPDSEVQLNKKNRLLRYDATDPDFVSLNKALWELCDLNEDDFDESLSLYDYLIGKKLNPNMLKMAAAGFSNTLCSNSNELSLKQAVKWSRIWHAEGEDDEEDGDYTFGNSYSSLVDHLKKDLQIELNTPITNVAFSSITASEVPVVVTQVSEEMLVDGAQVTMVANDSHNNTAVDQIAAASAAISSAVTAAATAVVSNLSGINDNGDDNSLVTITTKHGTVYRARKLVMTPSPHVIQNKLIAFSPALPAEVVHAYDCVRMNNITKVILKFSTPCWPKDLHGMIMVDDDFLLPEVWFRHVPEEVEEGEQATAYAVGFATSKYAERIAGMTQKEVLARSVEQLEKVFAQLEQKHMAGDSPDTAAPPSSLPLASQAYQGGMFWDWQPGHHKYIGGGYCSPKANMPINSGEILSKAFVNNRLFFAGEATNDRPGATAHAALETGIRAASLVSAALEGQEPVWKGYVYNKSP